MNTLVKKAQKGNDKAFLQLFQMYEQDIYRIAYVYVKNEEDASDVLQEVAYRSFKNIHTVREASYFKTWLIKITISCAIDSLRKNKNIVQLNPNYEEFLGASNEDIPLTLSIQELINGLNENEKSVVILKYYKDFSFKDIAETLDIPLGTAKSVLYRALDKLRKSIKEVGVNE
ncbi:RNA polymerase sigma factor [Brevibacillus daliensis]|uniref:RNA polymerase sigma factor n=1 Tax=Brevibacillus daliensis TaxID=2892995 RepID=UPI001E41F845|nr:RNA polymerase sigma factor [Brevibacillus daliensis]